MDRKGNPANPGMPKGEEGRVMLERMNGGGHERLANWGLQFLKLKTNAEILEIGCGGGANIARLLKLCPEGRVTGIDYSELSVEVSTETNKSEVDAGRVAIKQGSVLELPLDDESFDTATAFETIYFWQDIEKAFKEVWRILRHGGSFFICNETDGEAAEGYEWEKENDNLKIYKIEEVLSALKQAGFSDIDIHRNKENGWICFNAVK